MKENYSTYTSKELLDDDYFISSMIAPDQQSERFWFALVNEGIIAADEFEKAKSFMLLMRKPSKVLTAKERTELWVKIEIANKKALNKELRKRKTYFYSAVASLFVAISCFTVFLFQHKMPVEASIQDIMAMMPDNMEQSQEIQLVLSNEKKIELDEQTANIVLQEDGNIVVNSKTLERKEEKTVPDKKYTFNQLIVPYGRHSHLTLPDGTKMYINSGTKVVFPEKFKEKEREIYVNGEVYLEVARNEEAPFFIRTKQLDIQVLGTSLNVTAYEQDEQQAVVLLTGLVTVSTKDKYEAQLSPNQKLDYFDGKCAITSVNAYEYVSWKDGYFIYRKEPLNNIMKQLSRYYGVPIICSADLSNLTCSGKLDLKENIDKVMKDLSKILRVEILFKDNVYQVNKSVNPKN